MLTNGLLYGESETTYPMFTGQIKTGFVDRKPVFAGDVMHRFDCTNDQRIYPIKVQHIRVKATVPEHDGNSKQL